MLCDDPGQVIVVDNLDAQFNGKFSAIAIGGFLPVAPFPAKEMFVSNDLAAVDGFIVYYLHNCRSFTRLYL